jgi:hypothetical protein
MDTEEGLHITIELLRPPSPPAQKHFRTFPSLPRRLAILFTGISVITLASDKYFGPVDVGQSELWLFRSAWIGSLRTLHPWASILGAGWKQAPVMFSVMSDNRIS